MTRPRFLEGYCLWLIFLAGALLGFAIGMAVHQGMSLSAISKLTHETNAAILKHSKAA